MRSKALAALGVLLLAQVTAAMPVPGSGGPGQGARAVTWRETAVALRGQPGVQATFDCPARGKIGSVWGTNVYTDDSSICSAAAHAGAITAAAGGRIVIEIRAGEPSYTGTARNGVTSSNWGSWSGSFVVVAGTPGAVAPAGPPAIDWTDTAAGLSGVPGGPVTVICPAGGTAASLWGTGLYTDDSSICTAAVHTGAITFAKGGTVTFALTRGAPSYTSSSANGVTSAKWGPWSGSFLVLSGVP